MKLAHVAISVSHINKSLIFYRKHFGFRLAEKYQYKESGLTIAILRKHDITLELFEFRKHKLLPKYRQTLETDLHTIGAKHFSFAVADIKSAYRKFKKAGVPFACDMRVFDNGLRYFFIQDPDGILVEIMEEG
ncbi:MAG: VOC family protein [Candidatus Omnitrophota bacterium]|jgi:glyoxylase I family protein